MKRCIENNDQIIKLIIKDVAHIFENVCPTTAVDSVRKIYLTFFYYYTKYCMVTFIIYFISEFVHNVRFILVFHIFTLLFYYINR